MKVSRKAQRLAGIIQSAALALLLWREFGWPGVVVYLGAFLVVGYVAGIRDVMSQHGARP